MKCVAFACLSLCVLFSSSFADKPIIDGFPCQTGIADIPFTSPQPMLKSGTQPVNWSLLDIPDGMTIDPVTGIVQWEHPVKGYYNITISATNTEGSDFIEWQLIVVENDFEDPVIISSKYVDFVVPPYIAQWMEKYGVASYADACWELMRDTVGHVPPWGRQIVRYHPEMGGGGLSGNPVQAGPYFWHNEVEPGWTLGAFVHEVGHNFHGMTNMHRVASTGATWADMFFHHGMEFMQTFVALTLKQKPEVFINREAYQDFCWWEQMIRDDYERNTEHYRQWLSEGGRAEGYTGGSPYHPWGIICRELADTYGVGVLQRIIRAVRTDGLPISVYDMADTHLKVNTILFCIISKATGVDLRDYFDQWGFDVDQSFWDSIETIVADTIANLPNEDYFGWKRSPINGHYYRYTLWPMGWHEAEHQARQLGGHLVTIRSAEEDQWVTSRFYMHRPCWIGYTDQNNEGQWSWISGYGSSYERWNSFEPNGNTWENHTAMLWGPEEGWNDYGSTAQFIGLVEVPELPDAVIGDILEDRCVQLADIVALASKWLTTDDVPSWVSQPDLNRDGIINMMDFAEIADDWLNCEICIYPENIAEGKIATASSKYEDRLAPSMAINRRKYGFNFYHSALNDRDPWWMVDLEQEYLIKEIIMWNRLDCCQLRLQEITVEILDSNQSLIYSSPLLNPGNTLPPKEGWTGPEKIVLTIEPTLGQFVRIRRTPNVPNGDPDTYILTLAEVEVLVDCQP